MGQLSSRWFLSNNFLSLVLLMLFTISISKIKNIFSPPFSSTFFKQTQSSISFLYLSLVPSSLSFGASFLQIAKTRISVFSSLFFFLNQIKTSSQQTNIVFSHFCRTHTHSLHSILFTASRLTCYPSIFS